MHWYLYTAGANACVLAHCWHSCVRTRTLLRLMRTYSYIDGWRLCVQSDQEGTKTFLVGYCVFSMLPYSYAPRRGTYPTGSCSLCAAPRCSRASRRAAPSCGTSLSCWSGRQPMSARARPARRPACDATRRRSCRSRADASPPGSRSPSTCGTKQ